MCSCIIVPMLAFVPLCTVGYPASTEPSRADHNENFDVVIFIIYECLEAGFFHLTHLDLLCDH